MNKLTNSIPELNRFKTISEFKWCITDGGEVQFTWKEKTYGVFPKLRRNPTSNTQMVISQVCVDNPEETEKWYNTADELLEYIVDGDKLRDIITQVEVTDRTL